MKYYSTNKQAPLVDFREATIAGLAPDKGLYFPHYIPQLSDSFLSEIEHLADSDIGYAVMQPYVGNTIPDDKLREIIRQTLSFEIPLVSVTEKIASLELFHGPTFAFKDLGARFMSRCMGYFAEQIDKPMTVLVATSGDTGGAVANGFYNVPGVGVVILYPSGKVSEVQELQLTTLGGNIRALEVDGTFDDCQRMVKEAFADSTLRESLFLTSANSINVARWLPQQLFYFLGYKQWKPQATRPVVAVPSGNFGNICSGMLAKESGLPLGNFVVACNANDAVVDYLQSGSYCAKPTVATISNAMDVGSPSNFVRILELYGKNYHAIFRQVKGYTISDEDTLAAIRSVYHDTGYLLDPHGAVAYQALSRYLSVNPQESGFILETAHPIKFELPNDIRIQCSALQREALQQLRAATKHSVRISPQYEALKAFLLQS